MSGEVIDTTVCAVVLLFHPEDAEMVQRMVDGVDDEGDQLEPLGFSEVITVEPGESLEWVYPEDGLVLEDDWPDDDDGEVEEVEHTEGAE